uniref:Uncharacterized protein n=1 Tax=Tolypothrix bouteillei VB521301 TaxID=1479485 RepID=A0A0C1N896_9CYAN
MPNAQLPISNPQSPTPNTLANSSIKSYTFLNILIFLLAIVALRSHTPKVVVTQLSGTALSDL